MIVLGHTNSFETVFFKDFPGSAFTAIVLVKIVEPIEGSKAAQMGILGTACREHLSAAESLKVRLLQGLWGCLGKKHWQQRF